MARITTGLLPDRNILPPGATAPSLKQSVPAGKETKFNSLGTLTVSLYKALPSNLNYALLPEECSVFGSSVCCSESWF
jgi:hypothetical protein